MFGDIGRRLGLGRRHGLGRRFFHLGEGLLFSFGDRLFHFGGNLFIRFGHRLLFHFDDRRLFHLAGAFLFDFAGSLANGFSRAAGLFVGAPFVLQALVQFGQGVDGAAEQALDLGLRQHHGHAGGGEEAADRRRLVGDVENLAAGHVGDNNFAGEAAGFLEQRNDVFLALGGGPDRDAGAANADGGDRRAHGHGVGTGLGDGAGDEAEHALDHRNRRNALARLGVVNQLVEHHATAFAERKRGVVDKNQTDRAGAAGFDHVALINRVAQRQLDAAAVAADHDDLAADRLNRADGLRWGVGRGLRDLARRRGSGQAAHQIGAQLGAARRLQRRRRFQGEIIAHQELRALGPFDQQVRPVARKIGHQQHGAALDHQRFGAGRVKHDGLAAARLPHLVARKVCLEFVYGHGSVLRQ